MEYRVKLSTNQHMCSIEVSSSGIWPIRLPPLPPKKAPLPQWRQRAFQLVDMSRPCGECESRALGPAGCRPRRRRRRRCQSDNSREEERVSDHQYFQCRTQTNIWVVQFQRQGAHQAAAEPAEGGAPATTVRDKVSAQKYGQCLNRSTAMRIAQTQWHRLHQASSGCLPGCCDGSAPGSAAGEIAVSVPLKECDRLRCI